MIEVKDLWKNLEGFSLKGINLKVINGEYFVILGPIGSGKTLLLETIAGFHYPEKGSIFIDGNEVTFLPPEKRSIGFVYQDYLLFPHLKVKENIQFGLKIRKYSKLEIEKRTKELAETLKISHLLDRYPKTLSGGEQQKVALARALAPNPKVLLLDEPLSALDAETKEALMYELKQIHKELKTTTIHVTHDRSEAIQLADKIGVMIDGKIIQIDSPEGLFSRPKNCQLASFLGFENIIKGIIESKKEGMAIVNIDGKRIEVILNNEGYNVGDEVFVCIRPENIAIFKGKVEKTSMRNKFDGIIKSILSLGALRKIEVDCGFKLTSYITKTSMEELELKVGDKINLCFKATCVHLIKSSHKE
jgi:molybdate/tungstate transport system ATP-binding protein